MVEVRGFKLIIERFSNDTCRHFTDATWPNIFKNMGRKNSGQRSLRIPPIEGLWGSVVERSPSQQLLKTRAAKQTVAFRSVASAWWSPNPQLGSKSPKASSFVYRYVP